MANTLRSIIGGGQVAPTSFPYTSRFDYANIVTDIGGDVGAAAELGAERYTVSTSTYNSWTNLVYVSSGRGVIELMTVSQDANTSNLNWQFRLSINGTVVVTSPTTSWQATGDNDNGYPIIGTVGMSYTFSISYASLSQVLFYNGFSLQVNKSENAAGSITAAAICRYFLT